MSARSYGPFPFGHDVKDGFVDLHNQGWSQEGHVRTMAPLHLNFFIYTYYTKCVFSDKAHIEFLVLAYSTAGSASIHKFKPSNIGSHWRQFTTYLITSKMICLKQHDNSIQESIVIMNLF